MKQEVSSYVEAVILYSSMYLCMILFLLHTLTTNNTRSFFVFTGIILKNSLQDLLASTPWAYADDGYHQEAGTQA